MAYKAIRKNRVLTIAEEKADEYAGMGYTVTDAAGTIVAEPTENTLEGANQQIARLRGEIEAKNAVIQAKDAEIESLREQLSVPSEEQPEVEKESPKKSAKTAKS